MKLRCVNWTLPPELGFVRSKSVDAERYSSETLMSEASYIWVDLLTYDNIDIHVVVTDEYATERETVVRTYLQFLEYLVSINHQPAVALLRAAKIDNLI